MEGFAANFGSAAKVQNGASPTRKHHLRGCHKSNTDRGKEPSQTLFKEKSHAKNNRQRQAR
jgi:hypothetical protein